MPGIASHYGLPVAGRYTDPTAYLGPAHAAFDIKGDPLNPRLQIESLKLEQARFENRRSLSAQLDNLGRLSEAADESFDALTCVYLFHELPKGARRRVIREALRVLKQLRQRGIIQVLARDEMEPPRV